MPRLPVPPVPVLIAELADGKDVRLSTIQREILTLMVDGLPVREIAARLGVSRRKVETVRHQMMHAIDLRSTAELVRYAVRRGLVTASADKVFVVDEDHDARAAMCRSLLASGFDVEEFASAQAFLARRLTSGPACLVVDRRLPGLSPLELHRNLEGDGVMMPVVFVTTQADVSSAVQAMKSGAVDFLTKPVDSRKLVAAVSRGLARGASAEAERRLRAAFVERVARLTPRERQVATRVIQGLLNKQIAWELGTAEKTVKVHRGRVMEKLEVGSVAELVRLAERTGTLALGSTCSGGLDASSN